MPEPDFPYSAIALSMPKLTNRYTPKKITAWIQEFWIQLMNINVPYAATAPASPGMNLITAAVCYSGATGAELPATNG